MNDFLFNGAAHGDVATTLLNHNMDLGALRPYKDDNGRSYVTLTRNGKPEAITTNESLLRIREWITLDEAILRVARARLRAWSDLVSAGLTYNIPNGMGSTVLQTQNMGDISPATISMDGIRRGLSDRPAYTLANLPLPIIHKDFEFTARELAVARNGGQPLDTTSAELAGRQVAESVEKLLLGITGSYSYGGGSIYGYKNFPYRLTGTFTAPSTGGWVPATLLNEVLGFRQQLYNAFHFGPYVMYVAPGWDGYLDQDFKANGSPTLRQRLLAVEGISAVRTADFLTGTTILLVQMSSDVIRAVTGMKLTTVQWPSQGNMQFNFKVMTIMVPQIRADFNNNCGVLHAEPA